MIRILLYTLLILIFSINLKAQSNNTQSELQIVKSILSEKFTSFVNPCSYNHLYSFEEFYLTDANEENTSSFLILEGYYFFKCKPDFKKFKFRASIKKVLGEFLVTSIEIRKGKGHEYYQVFPEEEDN